MFDFVRRHNRLLQFVLLLLIIPSFVFFGVQGYSRFLGDNPVAEVAGQPVTQPEWDAAHRQQVTQMREQMPNVEPAFFDRPEVKREALDALVRERVLAKAAADQHLVPSDDRLQRLFASDPGLAFLRNPDGSANKEALSAQRLTSEQLATQLRQSFARQQVVEGVTGSGLAPPAVADVTLDALLQQRQVSIQRFNAKDYEAQIKPTDADLEAFYADPAQAPRFTAPEQADVEYVLLDAAALKLAQPLESDELRKAYEVNRERFVAPEERQARHVLIKAAADASPEVKAKARAKAQVLLDQLKAAPDGFAEVARKQSEDAGSAAQGGDLGYFARGAMVKPFEDAVFAAKVGEFTPVVESAFGFHVIQVTQSRGGGLKAFESLSPQEKQDVEQLVLKQRFAKAADAFNAAVEETSDLLALADRVKLPVASAQGVVRSPTRDAQGLLANPKLLAALFEPSVLRDRHNTPVVELGPQELVVARVTAHRPAAKRSFAEVKDLVRRGLVETRAAELARKASEAALKVAREGGPAALGAAALVSRLERGQLPGPVVDAVLKADVTAPPVWLGVDLSPEGYALARVDKTVAAADTAKQTMRPRYQQAWAQAEERAYYEALKVRYKVKLNLPVAAAGSDSAP